ncbi:4-(cytidine 5'-diphospho)-2-C-methyl-D-erythritol kinase [Candidatus Pelagibacter sp.]|nr:4-(cytidine 5'-diphospho)-2-C-methyl-D-erythritol kinase [Candidatus Pelagibacter sp.]
MRNNYLKSYAKINIALNVTGKRNSMHKIESIVSFIDLHDLISIQNIKSNNHKISFYGKFSKNIKRENTVQKLLDLLDRSNLLKNKKFKISIKKNIPQEAGLGGGSMNAAAILNFFIKKKIIKLRKVKIEKLCNSIGSDVILGINFSSSILKSNNQIKKFKKCPKYYTLLVKPNFGCSTKNIYSGVRKFTKPNLNSPKKQMFSSNYLIQQVNALEKIAFLKYPRLKNIKLFLKNLNSPLFVRMTGSGSAICAYYQYSKDCKLAKVQFKRKFKNYWCNVSKTI